MDNKFIYKTYNIERLVERLKAWPEAIKYFEVSIIKGLKRGTIAKNLCDIISFLSFHNRPISKITTEDVHEWLCWTKKSYLKESTFNRRIVMVRSFLNEIGREDLAKTIPKIKFTYKIDTKLITETDLKCVISSCKNDLEKTLIYMLHDTGCRVGELLTLRKKNIFFDDIGIYIIVNGKTGRRPVRITKYRSHLKRLYKSIKEPDDLVFKGKGYNWAYWIFRRVNEKCNRKLCPKMFRHTRGTDLWKKLPDQLVKRHMGWSRNSKMALHYDHLTTRDVDDALLKAGELNTFG